MSSSFFFLQADKNAENQAIITDLEAWASENKTQVYVIDRPLGDDRYDYNHSGSLIVLIPNRKIALVDFSRDEGEFSEFVEDFIEDLGSISDKFRYKEAIGRPRKWREQLVYAEADGFGLSLSEFLQSTEIADAGKQRVSELLVSLLTGSINDIERVKADLPENLLDKIKRKIILLKTT